MDISQYIKAKSDQLNADDLIGGPITVQVQRVTPGNSEQPVVVHVSGGHCPWKPSKTALRVLSHAWGVETDEWVGRWVELYRDESVKWAGKEVGGIRVAGMSHIAKAITLSLAESKGKKKAERVRVLKAPQQSGAPTADLGKIIDDNGLTIEQLNQWLADKGKPSIGESEPDAVARLAGWLAGHPEAIQEMRRNADMEVGE